MHWFIAFFRNYPHGASLLITVVLSVAMIKSPELTQSSISRTLTLSIFYPVQFTVSRAQVFRNIVAENEELHKQVVSLKAENSRLFSAIEKDSALSLTNYFDFTDPHELIFAEVVAVEPTPSFNSVVISAGRVDGVRPYMAVVTNTGVVGKVVRVVENSSLVNLIRQQDEHVSIIHPSSSAIGILSSMGGAGLMASFRAHISISVGDTVVTSGLGGVYPPNLPVGEVVDIQKGELPLFNDVRIRPFADLNNLRFVSVISSAYNSDQLRAEVSELLRESE